MAHFLSRWKYPYYNSFCYLCWWMSDLLCLVVVFTFPCGRFALLAGQFSLISCRFVGLLIALFWGSSSLVHLLIFLASYFLALFSRILAQVIGSLVKDWCIFIVANCPESTFMSDTSILDTHFCVHTLIHFLVWN